MERQLLKAIQTRYKGYRFRSRLEARWAVYLDALDVKWEYEPEGYDLGNGVQYLPDFWLPDERVFAEVKADLSLVSQDEWLRIVLLAQQQDRKVLILDGMPSARMYLNSTELLCDWESGATPTPPFRLMPGVTDFERCGLALWSGKGRFWWDEHCNFFSPTTYFGESHRIEDAAAKARSARFGR